MEQFHFACPCEVYFGQNCIAKHSHVFQRFGQKAYIITSRFPDKKNLALEDVETALKKEHVLYAVNEEVQLNPSVESLIKIARQVSKFQPDLLISIGGGSAIDTAKCVNILLRYPNLDAYDVLFGKGPHIFGVGAPDDGALPLINVPTTAGTGADMTGISVITRNDIQSKSGTNRRSFGSYSFVDSRYIKGSPTELNHATAVDALCHGIESYLSRHSRDDFMTNMIAETAFQLFGEFKEHLLSNTMTAEDYDKQALHSLLQGMVIINECTGVAHGLGYPLSYYYHVPHGLACGIFEGEYVKIYKDQKRVKRIMDAIGFNTVDEFCSYIQKILAPHIHISVTSSQIEEWTQSFCKTQWRLDRHPYPLTEDMVRDIYYRSLSVFITDASSSTKTSV